MIKFFLYIVSFLIIFLVLMNSPSINNLNNFMNRNKLLSFSTNQILIQQIIGITVFIFFFLTIIIVFYLKI